MIDWNASAEFNKCTVEWLKGRFERFPKSAKRVVRICDDCGDESEVYFYQCSDLCHSCSVNTDDFKQESRERQLGRKLSDKICKKMSKSQEKRYEDPAERRKTGDASKRMWGNPAYREKMVPIFNDYSKNRYNDPEERLKASIAAVKRYEDPMEYIKTSAAVRGIAIDDWEDFLYNYEDSRVSPEYSDWRQSVYHRDYHTCQLCNTNEGIIHAHHILPVRNYPELLLEPENGITLCKKCHEKTYGCEEDWADTFIMLIN